MSTLKKLTVMLVTLALLCSSMPVIQAQETNDDQGKTHVYLPLINQQSTSNQSQDDATDSDTADAVDASGASVVAKKVILPVQQKAALAFWNHATIAAAQPMEMVDASSAAVDVNALAQPAVTGPRGFAAGVRPASDAEQMARNAYPDDWAALDALAAAETDFGTPDGTSQIYTGYTVNQLSSMQNIFPHITLGRISFSTPGGTSFCSGTAISGNVMVTAAHCLYDTSANRWYSNWVFSPAYRNGSIPFGTFPATTCWVLNSWINLSGSYSVNTWAPHDVGVCKMGRNSGGQTLNGAVGGLGREWNSSYIRHVHNMGYPFNDFNLNPLPNAGLYLRTCVAETFQQTTEVRGMGCHIASGNSGAGWLVGYAPGVVTGWVTGVHSGGSAGVQTRYGPRFNSNNIVPLCNSAAC